MNLDPLSFALSQISYLVIGLTKKNYRSSVSECRDLVSQFGFEVQRHLLRCLFSQVPPEATPSITGEKSIKDNLQFQFLVEECESLCWSSTFISVLCWCVDNPLEGGTIITPRHLANTLRLSPLQELVYASALQQGSRHEEVRTGAKELIRDKLPKFIDNFSNPDCQVVQSEIDSSPELLHTVLSLIAEKDWNISKDKVETFLSVLRGQFSREVAPLVLVPLLYPTYTPSTPQHITMATKGPGLLDGALPDLVLEMGYHFTSSVEECRASLLQLGGREVYAATVAKVIGVMVRTHTGLDDTTTLPIAGPGNTMWEKDLKSDKTWNVEVFIQSVHELQTTLNWKEIIYELDHPGFQVKDRQGLILLMKALKLGLQAQGFQGLFPMDLIYRHWKNTEGQLSLFQQILRNPDVFCFAEQQCHTSATEILKVQPDLDNKDVATWRSLDLIETLLYLADNGHSMQVVELLSYPRQNCPDVLVLGLLQINPPITLLRQELLGKLFRVFLAPHPNSGVILAHAWHSQSIQIKPILMLSMADWYLKSGQEGDNEHSRLSRILDVAQDLKALSLMLNGQPFPFVIDLAILASRREYLNLEKWLTDKVREHGEIFVAATVKFLQRKIPAVMGPGPLKEDAVPKQALPVECLVTILLCLQDARRQLPLGQEVEETIIAMGTVCQAVLSRPRPPPPPPPGVLRPGAGPPLSREAPPLSVAPGLRQPLPQAGLFPHTDPLGNLPSQFSNNLQLGGGNSAPVSSSAFSVPVLGPLVSGPGSPNRMYGGAGTSTQAPVSSSGGGGSQSPFSGLVPPPHQPAPPLPQTPAGLPPPAARPIQAPPTMSNNIEQVRTGNLSGIFPEMAGPVSREVEDEANSYFQRIYNHPPHPTLTIDEVLEMLKKFQASGIQREQDVFNCMIKNLFEEYKFFPQYPDKELHITAQLFGGIIEHSLVTMIPLGLALRFVLEAVRKPVDTNMYYFGIAALDRFKARLKDYPQYCQHVASIPHFKEFPPHLIQWVEYGTQSAEPPGKPSAPVLPPSLAGPISAPGPPVPIAQPSQAVTKTTVTTTAATTTTIVRPTTSAIGSVTQGRISIANTTNIDTLLAAKQQDAGEVLVGPGEAEQDKIAFIFNNLSLMNMVQKAEELKDVMKLEEKPQHVSWLAEYLVMKRASIEPNFHTLYSNFLEALKNDTLYDHVVKETYKNIAILLRSDKSIANFSDRSLLKNLGHWLGLMLLARNKPILMIDLDLKSLVIEAYHNGVQEKQQEMLYVVPFGAKILESAAKSRVFKPPCPWTMGLMNLLAELHQEQDLKLNLKFEIEVLCKTLNLEINELRPGNLLKDYHRIGKLLSFKGFGVGANGASSSPALTHKQNESTFKKDPLSIQDNFNNSTFGAALTPPTTAAMGGGGGFGQGVLGTGAGVFSQPTPGSAGIGMGSVMMATPQAAATMTAQTAQAAGQQGPGETPISSSKMETPMTPTTTTPPVGNVNRPVDPKFHFLEINTSNLTGLVPHITVDNRLPLLKEHPELTQLIKLAIEKSVQEWISPVIERAIKIAITTCEQIVKKDFSLDFDENRMRVAAHHMVRNLTAGMAMITCRDHLLLSIKNNLKNIMMTLGRNLSTNATEAIDVTVSVIANDNVELACAFIQKKAVEKAIPEIDKRLNVEIELRKLARKEGRRYCDPVALTYQAERMPDAIRLKVGQVGPAQAAVYNEFARNIPGFKPLTDAEATTITPKAGSSLADSAAPSTAPNLAASDDCVAILDEVHSKLQPFIEQCTGLPATPHMAALGQLLETLHIARTTKEVSSVIVLIQKAVESLMEGLTPGLQAEPEMLARYRDANLLVLRALADQRAYGPNWTGRQVTAALIDVREEIKWNLDACDALVRSSLINLYEYDKYLAACMDGGNNITAINFAMMLVKIYLIDDRSNAHIIESDLFGTIEVLSKIANHSRNPPDGLIQLVDMIKMSSERIEQSLQMSGPTAQLHSGIQQAREFEDPPGLLEKTEFLLRDWVNMYHSPSAGKDSTKAFTVFVQQMNLHGLLKTDDLITRFFRMSTQMCVDLCYRALAEQNNQPTLVRAKCFHTLDAFVRLIALLVKHSGDQQNTITKVNLLNKVLGIVAGVLLIDHEVRATDFQQVPYHRIFIMLFLELNAPDQILEAINFQVLTAYCNMLSILRPAKAPGFAYAWLEIVSHRVFLGRILSLTPQQKGWPMFSNLLTALFKFLSPFLRNAELAKPVHRLYRGTLRVLLVLLHDFPEFLCDYHYGFCDVIPPNCIQMRNLILSAFPRNMRLPDPFTPNLKVDMLPEISIAPRMVTNFAALIKPSFKKDLDSYLKNRAPVSFLSELRTNLQVVSGEAGMRYNIAMINALVMYVGTQAIQFIRAKGHTPSMSSIAHSSHMDIFQNLAVDLDTEGRYLFLNCIANQLRYPNSHTHYFSCCLLYLFAEANTEAIQEQITRVLLERLIVNRPHPWGLLITFIELIKNPTFKFWTHEFVHCAPEIQKLFESVARSCMVASQPRQEPGEAPAPAVE